MLDLNDLYYFTVLVEKRSFSAAAEATGVPKATLSRRIRLLEQELGLRLANRTTRKFSLTEAGQEFYSHCERVMQEVRAAKQTAQWRVQEPAGRIRMTCAAGVVRMVMADIMPIFLASHPKIDVELVTTSRYVDIIEEGFDIAIRSHTAPLQSSSLIARAVADTRMILVASPRLFPQGLPEDPKDLEGMSGLQLQRRDTVDAWQLSREDGLSACVSFHRRVRCDDAALIHAAVLAGVGVAALPTPLCCADLEAGRLVHVLPRWHVPQGTVSLVLPSKRGTSPAVRAMVDFLAEALPKYLNV
ncbi:LysR substrate-binding domain-containing protein [Dyella soli]|nr:LysR substrate-binding domain-containing protein [Dyella soli]